MVGEVEPMSGKFWWERSDDQILENRIEALEEKVKSLTELCELFKESLRRLDRHDHEITDLGDDTSLVTSTPRPT